MPKEEQQLPSLFVVSRHVALAGVCSFLTYPELRAVRPVCRCARACRVLACARLSLCARVLRCRKIKERLRTLDEFALLFGLDGLLREDGVRAVLCCDAVHRLQQVVRSRAATWLATACLRAVPGDGERRRAAFLCAADRYAGADARAADVRAAIEDAFVDVYDDAELASEPLFRGVELARALAADRARVLTRKARQRQQAAVRATPPVCPVYRRAAGALPLRFLGLPCGHGLRGGEIDDYFRRGSGTVLECPDCSATLRVQRAHG